MRINKSLITFTPTSGSGSGTVTSVALTAPNIFTVVGSPITSSGTLAIGLVNQLENRVWASPATAPEGAPTFRLLVAADIPNLDTAKITTGIFGVDRGGTGASTLTGVLIGNGTSAFTGVAGTANQILRRNSANTAYEFFSADYLSNPMTSLGDMIYGNAAGAPLRLAPNTTTTRKYLSMLGDGTIGAAPTWEAITGISGSGTTNYIAKFTSSSSVGNSIIAESGTLATIYGDGQTYRGQSGAGLSSLFITNDDNSFGNRHETKISTQQLGSGLGRTIIQAASYNTSTNRGELSILTESGANFVANIGTIISGADNAFSLYSTSFNENVRLNTGGDSFINGGNFVIGTTVSNAKLQVNGGTLATTGGTAFMVSAGLTNGRLETYQSGTANCIHTFQDTNTYEISAGSTSGYVSGLVITGRSATLLPDRVAIYTRSAQRFQINSGGQLQLNNYTSASSFIGTPTAYLACDSSGNIITSNPSSGRNTRLAFSAEVPNTWSNMPNTLQFFDSSSAYVTQIDLTSYNQVRLIVNKQGTAGATGSKLLIRYQATTGAPFTESSYLAIGTSEVSLAVDTTNNILVTSWIDLASGAKSDVWVALMGIDGDTIADPVFGNIYAEFRYN